MNSLFMKITKPSLSPIKKPVQARSIHTLEAIFEATIQVLLSIGLGSLTTTKVAERAGVSVGTLYQYFPNKQALLTEVLQRHLQYVVSEVELACLGAKGQTLDVMAEDVVTAYLDAKFKNPELSRALYGVANDLGSHATVLAMTQRSQITLCDMLASNTERQFDDLKTVSFILSTALVGPVQALLASEAPAALQASVCVQLKDLIRMYLIKAGKSRLL